MVTLVKFSLSSPVWNRHLMYSFGVFSKCCSMVGTPSVLCDVRVTHVRCTPTVPWSGSASPVSNLMKVDLPAPGSGPSTRLRRNRRSPGPSDDLSLRVGVLEPTVSRFDDGFILVLHPFQETRRRKDELQFVVGQFGVLLRRRAIDG